MKYLVFRLGADRYTAPLSSVDEVLPRVHLRPMPFAVAGLLGIMDWHGNAVPVVDLCRMVCGAPTRDTLGNRILRTGYGTGPEGKLRQLGILVDRVEAVAEWEESDFQTPGISVPEQRALGPVVSTPEGMVQRVDFAALLSEAVKARLWDGA